MKLLVFRGARRFVSAGRRAFQRNSRVNSEVGSISEGTPSRLAMAGLRWPLKTPGWQKMFMSRASELLAESSSIHCQSLRARERGMAVWALVRRRDQSGLAQMAA